MKQIFLLYKYLHFVKNTYKKYPEYLRNTFKNCIGKPQIYFKKLLNSSIPTYIRIHYRTDIDNKSLGTYNITNFV